MLNDFLNKIKIKGNKYEKLICKRFQVSTEFLGHQMDVDVIYESIDISSQNSCFMKNMLFFFFVFC